MLHSAPQTLKMPTRILNIFKNLIIYDITYINIYVLLAKMKRTHIRDSSVSHFYQKYSSVVPAAILHFWLPCLLYHLIPPTPLLQNIQLAVSPPACFLVQAHTPQRVMNHSQQHIMPSARSPESGADRHKDNETSRDRREMERERERETGVVIETPEMKWIKMQSSTV